MSESTDEPTIGIDDEALPEDLRPGDENPLAGGLDDGETVGDLLEDGKSADESPDTTGTDEGEDTDADS